MILLSRTQDPQLRTMLGGLIENAIFLEMQQGKRFLWEVAGWRKSTRETIEVDFVLRRESTTIPVEVKCAQKLDRRNLSGIEMYLKLSNQQTGVLVSTAPYEELPIHEKKIVNISVYLAAMEFIESLV